ncbi:MAG: hypothetical protein M1836_004721 [Candelina mexicana]|nr:MAG: hypothetical protein M1836_004721 [Candelina mexicana]
MNPRQVREVRDKAAVIAAQKAPRVGEEGSVVVDTKWTHGSLAPNRPLGKGDRAVVNQNQRAARKLVSIIRGASDIRGPNSAVPTRTDNEPLLTKGKTRTAANPAFLRKCPHELKEHMKADRQLMRDRSCWYDGSTEETDECTYDEYVAKRCGSPQEKAEGGPNTEAQRPGDERSEVTGRYLALQTIGRATRRSYKPKAS